jgi:Ca2+-binding RTX toxin-like protein
VDGGTGNDLIAVIGEKNDINTKADDTTGDGNDTMLVLGAQNTVKAGRGDDWVLVCGLQNKVDGGAGSDTLCVVGWNNTVYGDYTPFDNGNDTLIFVGGRNQVQGNGGNDLILGAGLANQVQGNSGDDIVLCAGLVQNIDLGEGNDIGLTLGAFNNLLGGSGNDALYLVGAGNSTFGGDGNDFLCTFGAGNVLWGQDGNDVFLSSGVAMQSLMAQQQLNDGTAVIQAALRSLNLLANDLSQESVPQHINDYANQGPGSVTAVGGRGNDVFYSGSQPTLADGGEGQDQYHFYLGDAAMTVRDNGQDANQLTIHTEWLRAFGAGFDVQLSDFFFNPNNQTLRIVHEGVSYGSVVFDGFEQANDRVNWVQANGHLATLDLTQLRLDPSTAPLGAWNPAALALPTPSTSFGLNTLYDDLHHALAANRVMVA